MIMHRIWLGSKMPDRYKEYGDLWTELNPEHKLTDWTEEMIWDHRWINQSVLEVMQNESKVNGADLTAFWTHVADVIDYELIYKYGGWYFNTDMKPIRPLSYLESNPYYDQATPAFAMEDDIHPVNMAMYAMPNDPLFAKIIELLPKRYFGMPGAFMNATTGVQLIEQAIRQYDDRVNFYDRDIFNPVHWTDVRYGEYPDDKDYPEITVAVHEWLHRTNQRSQRILEI